MANAHLPGLDADTPPTVEEVVGTWTSVPDIAQPGYSGIIVDEFLAQGSDFYHVWTESIRQFYRLPAFENRTFYAWCGGDVFCLEPATDLFRVLQGLGGRFSWEKYLPEPPSESEARRSLISELRVPMQDWQERMPGLEQQLIVCLGYLSAPPETQNRDPGVDNHVFMDMQFQLLATDPAYWNLRGLMEYSARYADEESLRWAHQLIRHYCIEGNRTRLTSDPYRLPHLCNPDFAEGLEGWTVEAAEKGSISTKSLENYSHRHGRYPRTTQGNQTCRMRCNP